MAYYIRPPLQREPESGVVSFLAGCVAGIVIGGALGMLMAPSRGEVTRRKIVRHASEAKDQVVEVVEDQLENLRERKDDTVVEDEDSTAQ
jgi:gas vesicle protein